MTTLNTISVLEQTEGNPTVSMNTNDLKQREPERRRTQFRAAPKKPSLLDTLKGNVFTRLSISQPLDFQNYKTRSSIVPTTIPVSFIAVPRLLQVLWTDMQKRFSNEAVFTNDNFAVFVRTILLAMEAKVCIAQKRAESCEYDLTEKYNFTEDQLQLIKNIVKRVPTSVAIAIEAIGNFRSDSQLVTPVLAQFVDDQQQHLNGIVSFAPSHLSTLMPRLTVPIPIDDALAEVAIILNHLPSIQWERNEGHGVVQMHPNAAQFWTNDPDLISVDHRSRFLSIVQAVSHYPGQLAELDLMHGNGSAVALVRYPTPFDPNESETRFYTTTHVPPFDIQLSAALLYGSEHRVQKHTRFTRGDHNSYINGRAVQAASVHALIRP